VVNEVAKLLYFCTYFHFCHLCPCCLLLSPRLPLPVFKLACPVVLHEHITSISMIHGWLWLIEAWGARCRTHDSASIMEYSSFIESVVKAREDPQISTAVFRIAIPYNPAVWTMDACFQRNLTSSGTSQMPSRPTH